MRRTSKQTLKFLLSKRAEILKKEIKQLKRDFFKIIEDYKT